MPAQPSHRWQGGGEPHERQETPDTGGRQDNTEDDVYLAGLRRMVKAAAVRTGENIERRSYGPSRTTAGRPSARGPGSLGSRRRGDAAAMAGRDSIAEELD